MVDGLESTLYYSLSVQCVDFTILYLVLIMQFTLYSYHCHCLKNNFVHKPFSKNDVIPHWDNK